MEWQSMKDDSRVWIYQSDRILTNEECRYISQKGNEFILAWTAHGAKMKASLALFYNVFIVIFADESAAQASGCSIDSSVHFIQSLGKELKVDFFNRLQLAILKEEQLKFFHSSEIATQISDGQLSWGDMTFDNLVANIADFRDKWTIPLKNSWIAQTV